MEVRKITLFLLKQYKLFHFVIQTIEVATKVIPANVKLVLLKVIESS